MKNDPKSMGYNKSSSKKDVYNNKILLHEIRKISNKQPNFMPKQSRKRRTNEAQRQQKEGNKDHSGNKWRPKRQFK